jgi:putative ABC transport system permease protein
MRNIAPVVEGYAQIGRMTLRVLGVDIFAEREFRAYTLPDSALATDAAYRRLLTVPGAVMMSLRTATSLGLETADEFKISVAGKVFPAILVGVVEESDRTDVMLDDLVIADIATAQEWLGMIGRLTRIDVRLTGDRDNAAARDRIRRFLPADTQLLTAAGRTQTMAEMSNAFMTNLTAMSLLALLVGIFLIYNSAGFTVLQRRRLIGVLRALGVTRRQIFRLILSEALLLGIIGASFGVLSGVVLGERLLELVSRSINDHYFVVTVTDLALSPASILKGWFAGLGATLFAATIPALEATHYLPTLALARSVLERRVRTVAPYAAAAGLVMVMAGCAILLVSGNDLASGFSALFLLVLGMAFCIPIAVRLIAIVAVPVAARMGGPTGRLAISGVTTALSRTGIAIVALAVAVSATVGVSVMVESLRDSVSDWLHQTLRSDIYISAPGMSVERSGGPIDADLVASLTGAAGVADHSASRSIWIEAAGQRTQIMAVSMAPGSYAGVRLLAGDPDQVWPAFDNRGAVIVSDPYAYLYKVKTGDMLMLNTPHGQHAFPVAGIYQNYDANESAIVMARSTYLKHWRDTQLDSLGLYLKPGAILDDVLKDLREISANRQALLIRSNQEIRTLSMDIFDRTFVITNVLYWLAVVVAFVGMLSAMLAVQFENARELAILRAVGMTPGQLARLVTVQTGFIGLLSGLAAIPLGLVMAWVLIDVINRRAFGWQMDMTVSFEYLLTALAIAVGTAVLAGIYPAWRAANALPAAVMREE